MAGYGPDSFGKHHHVNCESYGTDKNGYLMYYEEAIDAWTFAPEKVENLLDLDIGDSAEIQFKMAEFTDKEIAEMPAD